MTGVQTCALPISDGYSADLLRAEVGKVMSSLEAFLRASYQNPWKLVALFREIEASYAIEVVFPDGPQRYRIEFGKDDFRIESGPAAAAAARMEHKITASALTGWVRRERSYFYLRAFTRTFSTLHELKLADGKVRVMPQPVPDLLAGFITYKVEGEKPSMLQHLDHVLKPYVRLLLSAGFLDLSSFMLAESLSV